MANTWVRSSQLDSEGRYVYTYTADQAQPTGIHMILETKDKFVDKNLFVKAIIQAGSLSSGSTTISASAANAGSLLTESVSQPSSGPYLTVTGSGSVSVGTAGWIAATTSQNSTSATKYYTIAQATFNQSGGSIVATTGGYIAANATAGTVASGTITNNTTKPGTASSSGTINRNNYIKIGAGYYDEDKYYLAQPNSGTYTVTAAGTNIDIDGKAKLDVAAGELTVSGGGLSAGAGHAELASDGYYNGSTYNTSDKIDITTQTSPASGYYKITASGYGSISRAAIKKQITTAGWLAADSSPVQQIDADSLQSQTGEHGYYIKKSILATTSYAGPTTENLTITVPEGYYPSDRTITVSKLTSRTPTTSYANTGLTTYFTATTLADNDADVTITPRYTTSAGYIAANTDKNNGGIGYWKIKTATPAFDGGTLTGSSSASFSNVTTSSTNNGIAVQTKYTANRTAVLYYGAVEGWVSQANDAEALSSASISATNGSVYYITGITVPVDKPFSVTTTSDSALDGTSTLSITNNAFRNTTVTNAGTVYTRQTTSGKGNLYGKAYGDSSDTILIQDGAWVETTLTASTTSAQTAYGKVTVAQMTGGSISVSSTDPGNSYDENTDAIVPANGYLVISAGYHGATKISIDTLLHDSATITSVSGVSGVLLSGYTAYDTNGNLLTGSIVTYTGQFSVD